MTDHGNGLWFPHKIISRSFEKNKDLTRQITEVQKLTINEGIKDKEFNEVIPEGAFVYDRIRNASYRYGENPSIEGALGEAMNKPSKRSRLQWGLVFLNIIFVCALIGWMLWRRYSQDAR